MLLVLENAVDFKRSMDAIAVLVDEAQLVINSEGVSLKATDPSQISMVNFELPKSAFKEFKMDEPLKLGLDLDYISQILSRARKDDSLKLELDKNKTTLKVTFTGQGTRSFTVPLIDVTEQQLPNPKIEFDAELRLTSDALKDAFKDAELISSHVVLEAAAQALVVRAHSSKGTLAHEVSKTEKCVKEFTVKNACKSIFPLDYLQDMLKASDVSTEVSLNLKSEAPVKVSYSIGAARVSYFLAPRIESE